MKMQQMWMNIKENTRITTIKAAAWLAIAGTIIGCATSTKFDSRINALEKQKTYFEKILPTVDSVRSLCANGEYKALSEAIVDVRVSYGPLSADYSLLCSAIDNEKDKISSVALRENLNQNDYDVKASRTPGYSTIVSRPSKLTYNLYVRYGEFLQSLSYRIWELNSRLSEYNAVLDWCATKSDWPSNIQTKDSTRPILPTPDKKELPFWANPRLLFPPQDSSAKVPILDSTRKAADTIPNTIPKFLQPEDSQLPPRK